MTIPADEGTETKANLNFNYDRLTGNNGVDHRADMSMIADDETLGLMGFQLSQGKDGVSDGYFAVLANRQQVTLCLPCREPGQRPLRTLNLYSRGQRCRHYRTRGLRQASPSASSWFPDLPRTACWMRSTMRPAIPLSI